MSANKKIYEKGLELLRASDEMYDILNNIGLTIDIDSDEKELSKVYFKMMLNPQDIIIEALGLIKKTENIHSDIFLGQEYTMDIYYPEDGDINFSITEDGLFDLIHKASDNASCKVSLWNCLVNKCETSKKTLIEKYNVYGFPE